MAIGDLVTADYMIEYNGLAIGGLTDFGLLQVDGLGGAPAAASSDRAKLRRHGMYAGGDFMGSRTITLTVDVSASSDAVLDTRTDELKAAFQPGLPASTVMVFQVPGVATGTKARVEARVRRMSAPISPQGWTNRLPRFIIQLSATDPLLYANAEVFAAADFPTVAGGITFPITFPITFGGGATGNTFTVTNAGVFDASPRFFLIASGGTVTDPLLTNVTTGKTFRINGTVTGPDFLDVRVADRTVKLNGTANRYNLIDSTSEWWDLAPGANEIQYNAQADTGSSVVWFWHRSAWT